MTRVSYAVEQVVGRHAWVLVIVTLVGCAYLQARAAGLWIARALRVPADDVVVLAAGGGAREAAPEPDAPAHHVRDVPRILARNVFDASAGSLAPTAPSPGPRPPAVSADALVAGVTALEPCEGTLRVVGAVDSGDPVSSFALLAPAGTAAGAGGALAYRAGQRVDGGMVAAIGWHPLYGAAVLVDRAATQGRTRCFYAQVMPPRVARGNGAGEGTRRAGEQQGGAGTTNGPATAGESALERGVQRTGEREYSVQRGVMNRLMENQADLMTMAQVVPFQQDGRLAGVQLARVRQGSLLARLGIQTGDVLTRIDGLEMNGPDRWLEAYTRLMRADHATVTLLRGGRPVSLDVNIH